MDSDVPAPNPVGPPSPTPPDAIAAYEQALRAVENHYDPLEDAATVLAELVTQHPPLAGTRLNATDEVTLGSPVEWLTSELTEVGSRLFAIAEFPVEEGGPVMKRQKKPKEPARDSLLSEKDYQEGLLRAEILGPDGWMDGLANAALIEQDMRELDADLRRARAVFKRLEQELRKRKAAARAPRRVRLP